MSNVIASGVSSTLTATQKEAFRVNVGAGSQVDLTVVTGRVTTTENNITTLSTPNNALTKAALNATGAAPIYACRAWVNFNGEGAVAIRASGNVSSVTDNGNGDYTVNFATATVDENFSAVMTAGGSTSGLEYIAVFHDDGFTATGFRFFVTRSATSSNIDRPIVTVSVFR